MNRLICICIFSLFASYGLAPNQQSAIAQDQMVGPVEIPKLFGSDVYQDKHQVADDPTVVRSRTVRINIELLRNIRANDRLVFNMFDDVVFTAHFSSIKNNNTWLGNIEGESSGTFNLVLNEDALSAIIRVPNKGMFRIRSLRNGMVDIQEIDETRFPACGLGAAGFDIPAGGGIEAGTVEDCDDGSIIEILILYTPLARSAAGGTAAILAEIDLSIANANLAYNNSLIATQLNLVHVAEISYDESGSYQDHLLRLTSTTDGFMDEVHALRNLYFADMVALIVDDGQYCGIAWLMPELSVDSQDSAFSVTTWYCAANFVLAHELGHNMGCCHAVGDGGGCLSGGLFPYSNGYRFNGNGGQLWRTVMAYSPGSRIPNFSNPEILFDGQPTGIAPGESGNADNAFTINQTSPFIANYRCRFSFEQTFKLLPGDGEAGDQFGVSVAISGTTGNEVTVIGTHHDDDNGSNSGSAYLFDATTAQQIVKLLPADGEADDQFGYSVGISIQLENEVAIVGAYGDDDNGTDSGSAYLFNTIIGEQIFKLLPSDGAEGDKFGYSVAISGDTAIVGARYDDDNGNDSGSAYLFDTTTGIQIAKLMPTDGAANNYFGWAVAISGNKCIVGALQDDDNGTNSGSAYIFDTATGQQIAKLLPTDGSQEANFGSSVAISGNTAIIGASGDIGNGLTTGAAYIFNASTSQQIVKLIPGSGFSNDQFGYSVAIRGTMAVVGARFHDAYVDNSGAAYLYNISDLMNPVLTAKVIANDEATGDTFGTSVAISGSPGVEVVMVGSVWDDDNGSNSGSAYVFVNQDGPGIPGDINNDGQVSTSDLLALLSSWGSCSDCSDCIVDLDSDCEVGTSDLLILLANWG